MSPLQARQVVELLHGILFDAEMEDIRLYDLHEFEEHEVESCGGDSTYGEFSFDLIDWVLSVVGAPHRPNDVICDLGSGGGRALLYLALRTGLPVVGVELSPTRHGSATALFDLAVPFLQAQQVTLEQRDITEAGGAQRTATIVFFANKLFEDGFAERALSCVDCPCYVVALKPIPSLAERLRCTARLPTSWHRAEKVWLYGPHSALPAAAATADPSTRA